MGDRDEVADVLQETAVVALVSLDRLRDPDRFGAWLCGIALNVARHRMRDARRLVSAPLSSVEIIDTSPGPAERAEIADLRRRVHDAVSHLADGQRDAVLLFYLQGLTHREVAEELNISINAVKARLHQARAVLEPKLVSLHEREEVPAMTARPTWIDVQITDVRRGDDDPSTPLGRAHVVVLTDTSADRHLPIFIGGFEATALATTIDSVEMPRPMTYQFAANLLGATDWRVREVRISALAAGTFYAQVILEHQSEERAIDARPSDALNMALLSDAPVKVDSTLFEECAAIDTPDWRNYQTTVPDLAAEVRQTNERVSEWLQARHHDAEPGGAQPSAT